MKVFTRGQREERWRRGYLTLSGRTNCTRMRGGVKDFGCRQWRQLQLKLSELTRLLALLSALAALIKTVSRHKKLITANNFRIKTFQSFLFCFSALCFQFSVRSSLFVLALLFAIPRRVFALSIFPQKRSCGRGCAAPVGQRRLLC